MPTLLFTFHVLSSVLIRSTCEISFSLYIPHIPAVSECSVRRSSLDFLLFVSPFPPSPFQSPLLLHSRIFYPNVLFSSPLCEPPPPHLPPQGFFGRPLRGRFSTVLLSRYLTMMLCTVDLGIRSSCPMAPSDLPSFQRSTTRCRCTTSCSLVFWQAAADPPAAPHAAPPMAPAAAAASVGADKRQTVVETRRGEQDNVTLYWSP